MTDVKLAEYKAYRSEQIAQGKKPLDYVTYFNWKFLAKVKIREA